MSKENPLWGYQRIQGELLKVGIEISASSIRRVIALSVDPSTVTACATD